MVFIFWFSLFFIIYTYVGYPCLLLVWSKLFQKKVRKSYLSPEPMVSVIVAARNEENHIGARMQNLLRQEFPSKKMEVVIVSDGSQDATSEIVLGMCNNPVEVQHNGVNTISSHPLKLIKCEESKGKPHAINLAVQHAKGEFFVFTDARQRFEPNAIKELIANFNDPQVGCVSGELVFYGDSDTTIKAEMEFYWSLEKRIRKMESAIHSVPGATGAIYAIRESLFQPLPEETLLDDVLIPMNVVFHGYRNVFDGKAVAYDAISKDLDQEKRRKVRTLLGNYQLLQLVPALLSPAKNPIFFRYLSHKVFRLVVPFFFLIMLFSSLMADGLFYDLAFIGGILTIVLSATEKTIPSVLYLDKVCKLSRTFVSFNYFALLAFYYFIMPGKKKAW